MALGDLNRDGFPDLVAGANFAGSFGRAYVFYGSAAGFLAKPSSAADGRIGGDANGRLGAAIDG